MNWALRRQIFYVLVIVFFFSACGFLAVYPSFHKAPTCFDGVQNGSETGIDCGGSCANACFDQVSQPTVLWARAFEVVPGRYNAVAYIVNHNKNSAVEKVSYRFRFADANNVYIGKREGTTFIPPGGNFAVFEPAIDVGNSIPVITTFEFTDTLQWLQVSQDKIDQLKVLISDIQLSNETTSPSLSATIKNTSLFAIPNVSVVAILYDASGNAVSVSKTLVSQLNPLQSAPLSYSWLEPFPGGAVVKKELIPMYDIFSAKLQ